MTDKTTDKTQGEARGNKDAEQEGRQAAQQNVGKLFGGIAAKLDPDIWANLDVENQTFAIIKDAEGTLWAAPYSDIADKPKHYMDQKTFDAYLEAEAKYIDSFAAEVAAGEWGPVPESYNTTGNDSGGKSADNPDHTSV